jgi:hypothetical protein
MLAKKNFLIMTKIGFTVIEIHLQGKMVVIKLMNEAWRCEKEAQETLYNGSISMESGFLISSL